MPKRQYACRQIWRNRRSGRACEIRRLLGYVVSYRYLMVGERESTKCCAMTYAKFRVVFEYVEG